MRRVVAAVVVLCWLLVAMASVDVVVAVESAPRMTHDSGSMVMRGAVPAGPSPSELIGRLLMLEKLDPPYLTKVEHDRLIAAADQRRTTSSSSEDKNTAASNAESSGRPLSSTPSLMRLSSAQPDPFC